MKVLIALLLLAGLGFGVALMAAAIQPHWRTAVTGDRLLCLFGGMTLAIVAGLGGFAFHDRLVKEK